MIQLDSERYSRQEIIEGWDQEKIKEKYAVLIGSGRLSDFLLVDLLSLGIGTIDRIGYSNSFEFEKINPGVNLDQIEDQITSMQLAEVCIEDADLVIDATNSLESKFYLSEAAKKKGKLFISASATFSDFSIFIENFEQNLLRFHEQDQNKEQGNINSMVCSGILTDELRKRILPFPDDVPITRMRYSDIKEPKRIEKKILQIGAGAIGTFSALGLAPLNPDISIMDFDYVETTNLNRQFLFYDCIGRNKAEALVEKLNPYSKNLIPIEGKVEENFNPSGYDLLFCCVDNNKARYYLDKASNQYNIPIINGGSGLSGGVTMPYFPGKTACLDCQTGFKISEAMQTKAETKRRTGACFHPSIITSNQIVGGLMINCLVKSLSETYEKTSFSSGFGIFNKKVNEECFEKCEKNGK